MGNWRAGASLLVLLVDPNHSQIPAQPLLAAHRPSQARPLLSLRASFHLLLPFTRFPPLFFLISQFYFHFSFRLLPFTRSLLWFLTLFSTWHSSSLKQVPSFPVQQISPCRSFLFLTSPLPPIYRIRILLYFPLVVTSHLFLII